MDVTALRHMVLRARHLMNSFPMLLVMLTQEAAIISSAEIIFEAVRRHRVGGGGNYIGAPAPVAGVAGAVFHAPTVGFAGSAIPMHGF